MNYPKVSQRATRLIIAFGKARANLDWIGASHPDDHEAMRNRYELANRALRKYIAGLEDDREWLGVSVRMKQP